MKNLFNFMKGKDMSVLNAKNAKTYVNFGDMKSLELYKNVGTSKESDNIRDSERLGKMVKLISNKETAMKSDGILYLLGANLILIDKDKREDHVVSSLVKFVKKNPDDLFFISEKPLKESTEDALVD